MPEPMFQVPVSLIREVTAALGFHVGERDDLYRRVDALLSQPTLSAERHHPACGALDEPCHCVERGDAAPPSIADMVPEADR